MARFIGFCLVVLILSHCSPPNQPNRFSDLIFIRIADFQDRRLTDSLEQFLRSEYPTYRGAACLALASIQDTVLTPLMGTLLLEDRDALVRAKAAFALGQTGGIAAVNALIPAVHDTDPKVVREVLEALGKTVNKKDVETLRDYVANDTLAEEGLAWAFYRLGLRNLQDSTIVVRESEFLKREHQVSARLAGAHFFARVKLSEGSFESTLINSAKTDPDAEVRMAAVAGLKTVKSQNVLPLLEKILKTDPDYRVRSNAIRACISIPWKESEKMVFDALRDSSIAVRISASELILKSATATSSKRLEEEVALSSNMRIKANLFGAWLNTTPSDKVVQHIITLFGKSNDYGKAELLASLGNARGKDEAPAFHFLSSSVMQETRPVVKSSAALAIVSLNYHREFFKSKRTEFVELYRQAIAAGDPVVVGIISGALADSALGFNSVIHDISFLRNARMRLQLPRDIESLQPLDDAIAYFENKPRPRPPKNPFNHPINWKLVKSIPAHQHAHIITTKGEIILRLFVEEAPGSVANFVELANKKYFDGRYFHRVVPNFVVQTGCIRGDGFGSEGYSIRSEFTVRRYKTGSAGMASAGKDTEGTQWFITHSPTPHLDGRYTLFAEIVKGQEIVDKIEVGDTVLTVRIGQD